MAAHISFVSRGFVIKILPTSSVPRSQAKERPKSDCELGRANMK